MDDSQTIAELRQALAYKEQLLMLVAHDIKTPLAGIIGFVKLIQQFHVSQEEHDAMLNRVLNSAEQINSMVSGILEHHNIRNGTMLPDKSDFPAHDLIRCVLEERNLTAWAKEKNVTIVCHLEEVTLNGDKTLLASVVQNLTTNAIKFCGARDQITLSVKEDSDYIRIEVADTGTGMSEAHMKKIFAFHEPTSTRGTNGEKGHGFGLPLCREIVKAHGGSIKVTSAIGKGSTFTVELPK